MIRLLIISVLSATVNVHLVNSQPDNCLLQPESGPCYARAIRYFYNAHTSQCETFVYGGCMGNSNNFPSAEDCFYHCQRYGKEIKEQQPVETRQNPVQSVCSMPRDPGHCVARVPAWYFDRDVRNCQPFIYSGCGGNRNLFATRDDCLSRCGSFVAKVPQPSIVEPLPLIPASKCYAPMYQDLLARTPVVPCKARITRYQFNMTARRCEAFIYGGCPPIENMFLSIDECTQTCGSLIPVTPPPTTTKPPRKCVATNDVSDCYPNLQYSAFYFNSATQRCERGCSSRNNRFRTLAECQQNCMARVPVTEPPPLDQRRICHLPPDSGTCYTGRKIVNFFYNASANRCQPMSYGGCGGNANRFPTPYDCERACLLPVTPRPLPLHPVTYTMPVPITTPQPYRTSGLVIDICEMSPDIGPCRASIPMFFFNKNHQNCEIFYFGGCDGNGNKFTSREDCERRCLPQTRPPETTTQTSTTTKTPTTIPMATLCPPDSSFATCNYDPCNGNVCFGYPGAQCVPDFCYCKANFFFRGFKVDDIYCIDRNDTTTEAVLKTTTETKTCQNGLPYVKCSNDPCYSTRCPGFPYAECLKNECGQCSAHFFVVGRNVTDFCQGFSTPLIQTTSANQLQCPPNTPNIICSENPCNRARCIYFRDATCVPSNCGKCSANFYINGYKIEECTFELEQEPVTVSPLDPKSRCYQPVSVGQCYQNVQKYFYNATRNQCSWFAYSGCGGTENRFDTLFECQESCVVQESTTTLKSTAATTSTSTMTASTQPMNQCSPNTPKFQCGDLCSSLSCPGYPDAICVVSNCGECKTNFFYRGFKIDRCSSTMETTMKTMPITTTTTPQSRSYILSTPMTLTTRCNQPLNVGSCSNSVPMFFHNSTSMQCEAFNYSGCGGNGNLFNDRLTCEQVCNVSVDQIEWSEASGTNLNLCPKGVKLVECLRNPCDGTSCPAYPEATCLPTHCGYCGKDYYIGNKRVDDCHSRDNIRQPLIPGWPSINACYKTMNQGVPCQTRGGVAMYFYNTSSSLCERFYYSGCGGNENAFPTIHLCNSICGSRPESAATTQEMTTSMPSLTTEFGGIANFPRICTFVPDQGTACLPQPVPKYFFDPSSGRCNIFYWRGCGGNANRFDSALQCYSQCSVGLAFPTTLEPPTTQDPRMRLTKDKIPPICIEPLDQGTCSSNMSAYFFNSTSLQCEVFNYSGCGGNNNKFFTLYECQSKCTQSRMFLFAPTLHLGFNKFCFFLFFFYSKQ